MIVKILYFLPKNILSYLFGVLAAIPVPRSIRPIFYGWYAKRYGVQLEEAAQPLVEYRSLQEFFTRKLKDGVRPVAEGIVSPVDGRVVVCGQFERGELLQAKGMTYTLAGLLKSSELAERFNAGSYMTVYLAPGDYHHIHSPVSGQITSSTYIPGSLWPVNDASVEHVDKLFTKNERITTVIESDFGAIAVVKVGATNVGSIRTAYNSFRANPGAYLFGFRPSIVHSAYQPGIAIRRGDLLGSFFLGSTVIVLAENSEILRSVKIGTIRYGESVLDTSKAVGMAGK